MGVPLFQETSMWISNDFHTSMVFTAFQMSPPWVLNRVPFRKGANWEVQLVFVHGYIYGITLWDSNSCKCFVWALIGLGCTSSPLIKLDLQPQVEQALSDKISLFGFPPKKAALKKAGNFDVLIY